MKKSLVVAVLCMVLALFSVAQEARVTMYAKDGRTISIAESAVEDYKKVGWYEGVTVWAIDGRSKVISPFKVEEERAVGWYANQSDAMVTMYALDGRQKQVYKANVEKEKAVGWYTEPVVLVYAADGRSKVVAKKNVEAEKAVGWYDNKADVMVTMYAPDGRQKEVFKGRVEAEKAVGWHDNRADVYVTVYAADGRQKEILKINITAEQAVGWYTYPVMNVYAADGRSMVIKKDEEIAYRKVGWYDVMPSFPTMVSMGDLTLYKNQCPVFPLPDFYPAYSTNIKDYTLISSNTNVATVENYFVGDDNCFESFIISKNPGKSTITLVAANGVTDTFTVTVKNMTFYNFGSKEFIPDFGTFANTKADKKLDTELTNNKQRGYKYSGVGSTLANAYCDLLDSYQWISLDTVSVA